MSVHQANGFVERRRAGGGLMLLGPFLRCVAFAIAAGDEQHRAGRDTGDKRRVVSGAGRERRPFAAPRRAASRRAVSSVMRTN